MKKYSKSDKLYNIKKNTSTIENRIKRQQDNFIVVYANKACNISEACKAIGITRKTFYDWRKKYPTFNERCSEIEASLIDFAESRLIKNISEGKETSLFFFLVNRASDRWRSVNRVEFSTDNETGKKIDTVLDGLARMLMPSLEKKKGTDTDATEAR